LLNNFSREINLYGRSLASANTVFQFPQDTIIAAGQRISFASSITGITEPAGAHIIIGKEENEEDKLAQITKLYDEVSLLEEKVARMTPPASPLLPESVIVLGEATTTEETAAVINALPHAPPRDSNWLTTLKSFFLWIK
jgi:hypothetical protein